MVLFMLKGIKNATLNSYLDTFILILTVGLIGLAAYIHSQIVTTLILSSSKQVLMKQEYHAISMASVKLQQYINKKNELYIFRLSHLNVLFEFQIKNKQRYTLTQGLLSHCPRSTEMNQTSTIYKSTSFCYFACGVTDKVSLPRNDEAIQTFNTTIQLINQFIISIDATQETQLVFTDFSESIFFAGYPDTLIVDSYTPRIRIWYTNHIEKMKEYPERKFFFSPVYKHYINQYYQMSLTFTISGQNDQNIGIVEQVILIQDDTILNIPYNILQLNEQGEVIFASIESIDSMSEKLYIYNENKTGFNFSDWQIMQNEPINPSFSSCVGTSDVFCLFNSYFNKDVIINVTHFNFQNVTLVMYYSGYFSYTNITYSKRLEQQFDLLTYSLWQKLATVQYEQTLSSIVLITLAAIIIYYMFYPLRQLMKALCYTIKSAGNNVNVEIFKMLNKKAKAISQENTFSALRHCFFRFEDHLNSRLNKKNQVCLFVEQLSYPFKEKTEIPDIIQKVKNLEDNLNKENCCEFVLLTTKLTQNKGMNQLV